MDRSAIKALRKRGKSLREIADFFGCDKDTVSRIIQQETDVHYQRKRKGSQVDEYTDEILGWIKAEVPVKRMLELAEEHETKPYQGSRSVFYDRVRELRAAWELEEKEKYVRFEGLPAEYAQIDWGEVRSFPFHKQGPSTVYFFAARLKWSRFSYVEFTRDMRLETLVRCMLRAFESFGGVPWVCVFDNMKTVTTGRDANSRAIWNAKFFKFMVDIDSHPEACWPASGNQKGSVENLVGWVKSNFLKGREFIDFEDLQRQCSTWVVKVNGTASQAHGLVPAEVLPKEQAKFTRLKTTATDYGLFEMVQAGPDMLVHIDSNRYMVPVGYVGRPLVARVRQARIDFYDGDRCVATYERRLRKERRPIQNPDYCEPVLAQKPRARIMLYRDHLMQQDASIEAFIAELCHRHRGTDAFGSHVLRMWDLWKAHGTEELGVACAIASEHGAYGSEYLVQLLRKPRKQSPESTLALAGVPPQHEVDRGLHVYERLVEGGES